MEERIDRIEEGKQRDSQTLAFAGLFVFTLLLYWRPNEMFPELFGEFPLAKIVAIATLVAYIASRFTEGKRLTIWPIELKMLLVIAALGIAFIPTAAAPQDSIDLLTDVFFKVIIIFVLMINVLDTRERLRSMLSLVVICGTILSLIAIGNYLSGHFAVQDKGTEGRVAGIVGGIFGNPNDLATSLDLLIPFSVALALTSRGLLRLAYFAFSAILASGVVLTFSRGGFLGLIAMSAVLMWKVGRRNRAVMVFAFMAMLAVFVTMMPGGYADRITTIFDSSSDPTGSSQARKELLERAASVAAAHPLIGVGAGNYHIYSIREQRAHNSYLEIASELGLAGLVAYLIMIFAPLKQLRRVERDCIRTDKGPEGDDQKIYYLSVALQASIIAYIVCSFFGSIQYLWYVYFPIGYAISLRNIHAAEREVSPAQASESLADEKRRGGVLWRPDQKRERPSEI